MKYYLYQTFVLMDDDVIASQICQAQGQLSAKSRIDKSCTKKDTSPPKRGPATKRPGNILWELDPFKRWDKRTGSFWEVHIPISTQVIGCGLLAFAAVGSDNEVSPYAITVKTTGYLRCR
jgi:hypothetical protein